MKLGEVARIASINVPLVYSIKGRLLSTGRMGNACLLASVSVVAAITGSHRSTNAQVNKTHLKRKKEEKNE